MDDPRDGATLEAWIERCRRLEAENQHLRAQLARLGFDRSIPHEARATLEAPKGAKFTKSALNTAQKIALFRSLFRGRENVYAQRWKSPDGRSGYSPKTERDWKAYYAAIHAHLSGKHTLGLYPLLLDETCWLCVGKTP